MCQKLTVMSLFYYHKCNLWHTSRNVKSTQENNVLYMSGAHMQDELFGEKILTEEILPLSNLAMGLSLLLDN